MLKVPDSTNVAMSPAGPVQIFEKIGADHTINVTHAELIKSSE